MNIHILPLVETSCSTAAQIAGIVSPARSVGGRSCTYAHLIPTETKFVRRWLYPSIGNPNSQSPHEARVFSRMLPENLV